VTGVQTCALPIYPERANAASGDIATVIFIQEDEVDAGHLTVQETQPWATVISHRLRREGATRVQVHRAVVAWISDPFR
jgi:hypothetical protein